MKKNRNTGFNEWVFIFVASLLIAYGLGVTQSGDGIEDGAPKYRVDDLYKPYLKAFIDMAKLDGLDLTYVYTKDITIVSEHVINKNSTNVATSYGRNKDKIIIVVNKERFMNRTEEGRRYVMYHELGHDILNFGHLENGDRGMMESTAYSGFFRSYTRFSKERQENYLYTSLKGMFNRFKNK